MSEKHSEREFNPLEEIPPEDGERLGQVVDDYLEDNPGFSEVTDKDVDEILARLIEKGAELSPDVRRSLRRAAHHLLGIRLRQSD